MKLLRTKTIKGKIKVETGLHIGAGNDAIEIGGMDNPIIRDPLTNLPYIPGSSLKGKMRSLLEWKLEKVQVTDKGSDGEPCRCGKDDCPVCRVYGAAISKSAEEYAPQRGPTRIIVRDALLSEEFKDKIDVIVEEKSENSINRITAKANPRPIERVVPGVTFDFEIAYRIIDTGDGGKTDNDLFKTTVLDVLKMLENDYLGGGGSRGNGKIKFIDLRDEEDKPITL